VVEEDYEVSPLPDNPTMTQIKIHKDKKIEEAKTKATLYSVTNNFHLNHDFKFNQSHLGIS